MILRAGESLSPAAEAALGQLCRDYWYPLYAFVRRRGHRPEEAQDLTQAFFAELLEKNALRRVDRVRGRFRTFLLTCLQHFLINEWDKSRAVKRGGRFELVSWDELQAEERYQQEPADGLTPEKLFDRRWATTLLDNVMRQLRDEHRTEQDSTIFEALQGHLSAAGGAEDYQSLAARLGLSEAATKMRVSRLRRRYGELLRMEVAKTVAGDDLEAEMRHLLAVWS